MIKKIAKFVFLSGVLLSLSSCTVNKPAEQLRTITVTGTGIVTLPADQLTLKFLVKTSEWSITYARDKNAESTTKVLTKLKELGISDSDITTLDYKISQDNSNNYPGKFTITNYIQVVVQDVTKAGEIIDAAIVNGANGLTSFTYSAKENTTAVRESRTLAVQNAQDAANLIAGASGCKVLDVIDISEDYNSSSSARSTNGAMKLKAEDSYQTPIVAGTVSITSHVTITYSLTN